MKDRFMLAAMRRSPERPALIPVAEEQVKQADIHCSFCGNPSEKVERIWVSSFSSICLNCVLDFYMDWLEKCDKPTP